MLGTLFLLMGIGFLEGDLVTVATFALGSGNLEEESGKKLTCKSVVLQNTLHDTSLA